MLKYHFDVTLAINTLLLSMEGKHYITITQLWGLTLVQHVSLLCVLDCTLLYAIRLKKLYLPFDNKRDSICSEFQNKLFFFILQPGLTNSPK